jgi:hypothetical protein
VIPEKVLQILKQESQKIEHYLEQNNVRNDYGVEALQWLEDYIDQRRERLTQSERTGLITMIGAFLGECLIRANGGEWIGVGEEGHKKLGVQMDINFTAMPFAKVGKYLDDPSVDSFVGMFQAVPPLLKHVRDKHAAKPDDKIGE